MGFLRGPCRGYAAMRYSPAGKDVGTEAKVTIGIRYQGTTGDDIEDCMCFVVHSELYSV
jgi:hypothetical protein